MACTHALTRRSPAHTRTLHGAQGHTNMHITWRSMMLHGMHTCTNRVDLECAPWHAHTHMAPGTTWKSQDASLDLKDLQEGAPEPCQGKPRWGSLGLIRPTVSNTIKNCCRRALAIICDRVGLVPDAFCVCVKPLSPQKMHSAGVLNSVQGQVCDEDPEGGPWRP